MGKSFKSKLYSFFKMVYRYFKNLNAKPPPSISEIIPKPVIEIPEPINTDLYLEFYKIAHGELGVKEDFWGDNPKIIEYHDCTTLSANNDETPWCASFINWVLVKFWLKFFTLAFDKYTRPIKAVPAFVKKKIKEAVSLVTEDDLGDADPNWLPTFSAGAWSFATWGYKLKKGRKGCIVVMRRLPNPNTDRHVGIYDHEDENFVYLLGGNQGNAVNIRAHKAQWVLEYRGFYPEK